MDSFLFRCLSTVFSFDVEDKTKSILLLFCAIFCHVSTNTFVDFAATKERDFRLVNFA